MRFSFLSGILVAILLLAVSCSGQQEAKVKVMTFNIRLDHAGDSLNNWKYRKNNVGMMLNEYAPDIIGMQEVMHNQLADLKDRLPQYTALGVGRTDGKEKGEYCPVFYKTDRFELLDYDNYSLSEKPDSIGLKGWDAACERIVTWAVLKEKQTGKRLAIFNTHLDHIGQVARREGARMVTDEAARLAAGVPIIITGDFNASPNSEIISIITGENPLNDTRRIAETTYGPDWTFHDFGRLPLEQRAIIDYIFIDPNINVVSHQIIDNQPDKGYLSDHNPVITKLAIK